MSTPYPELPGPNDEVIQVINERASKIALTAAQTLCAETIELVYDGIQMHLQSDKENHDACRREEFPAGAMIGSFVLQGPFAAPRKEGEFVETFSTRLEPRSPRGRGDYMKLYVPVGSGSLLDYEMPPFDEVQEVYVERNLAKETHWYAINKVNLFEYIPLVYQDEDSEVLSEQGIWHWIHARVPETLETISALMTQITNMATVPQKLETIQPVHLDSDD